MLKVKARMHLVLRSKHVICALLSAQARVDWIWITTTITIMITVTTIITTTIMTMRIQNTRKPITRLGRNLCANV